MQVQDNEEESQEQDVMMTAQENKNIVPNKKQVESRSVIIMEAHQDDKRAGIIELIGYIIITIVVLAYFIYECIQYQDSSVNSITRTEYVKITDFSTPYFVIIANGLLYNLSILLLAGNVTEYETIEHVDYINFEYGITNENKWILVNLEPSYENLCDYTNCNTNADNETEEIMIGNWFLMLVPPINDNMDMNDKLEIYVSCIAVDSDIKPSDDNDTDYSDELIEQYTSGDSYALYWFTDSINSISSINNLNFSDEAIRNITEKLGYQRTFVSTANVNQIQMFEEKNYIDSSQDSVYYDVYTISSLLAKDYTAYDSTSGIWYYTTYFEISYDPTGGGYKTLVKTDKLYSFTDVLSKTGGIFSGANSFVGLVALWLIFGISIFGRAWSGFAPLKRLDDKTRKQIQVYLEEIGLIDTEYTSNGLFIIKPRN